ncbi:MAG TPA: ABC transporter ATP-binding protein [Candidatus Polarisedimenticolia bacterium]|nr:ABC transporter ATP-binding protein [Candidatus Polarisedimenticolia bacterium]
MKPVPLPDPSVPALDVRGVSKVYGTLQALDGITLTIARGELFGLLGPNGAGKSTLINIITGLVRRSAGNVKVFGYDVERDYKATRSLIGAVPQELIYDHFFTVRQTLKIQSGYYGLKNNGGWVEELMQRLELKEHENKTIRELSGGMKRRLLVAKAMVHHPAILILDEPTAGVDVALRRSLWDLVRQVHSEGTTVVLTTHYLEEAEELCDRIGIIDHGVFVALDRKEALMHRIHNRRVTLLFGARVERLPEELARLGGQLSHDGRRATLRVDRSDGSLQKMVESLGRWGLPLSDIEVAGAGLEDVFLELTARAGRQPRPASTEAVP